MKQNDVKLQPPAAPAAMVERLAVWGRISQGRAAKLVLVRAPAGYGKSTVMAQAKARLRARRAQADGLFNAMYTESLHGIMELMEGKLRHAMARFRMAVGASRASAYLHGDVDAAQRALVEFEWAGSSRQLPRVVAAARLDRSRLFLMQGNARAAREEHERAANEDLRNIFVKLKAKNRTHAVAVARKLALVP